MFTRVQSRPNLDFVKKRFPDSTFSIWRDGVRLTEVQVFEDIKSYEIRSVREGETKLPPTYRHGLGSRPNDVAIGPNGEAVKVWGPDNPEDLYK